MAAILLSNVVEGVNAQTYTQMQWGMNKGVTPYAFGANINGTWSNLGTVSSAGVWGLTPNTLTVSNGITAPYTNNFYTNLGAVNNQLLGGRQLLGKATNYSGSNSSAGVFSSIPQWLFVSSQTVSWSQNGLLAVTGISRASDHGPGDSFSIGIAGYGVADTALPNQPAQGGYFEAYKPAGGTNQIFAVEVDAGNNNANVINNPYSLYGGGALGIAVAAGGSIAAGAPGGYAYPSTAGILISNNTQSWNTGILFGATSITGTDGVTGNGTAIELAKGHTIEWYTPSGFTGALITSSVADATKKVSLAFGENFVAFSNQTGAYTSTVENVGGSVNYLRQIAQTTGNAPQLLAGGSDTNVDLSLSAKGTGSVVVDSPSSFNGAATFNVNPTIKGSSTGVTTLGTANSGATNYTATLPANTGTIAETNLAQTFSATQTFSSGVISAGTTPTATGAGGTCAAGTVTGGALVGTVALTGICAATNTLALTSMPAATTGYVCDAADRTLGVVNLVQTATTTTSATFTFITGASTGATDVIQFKCLGY